MLNVQLLLRYFILLCLLSLQLNAFSNDTLKVKIDSSSTINVKKVADESIEKYINDKEFLYDRIPPPAESPWEAFKRWLNKLFNKYVSNNLPPIFWDILIWTIVAAALILIIYRLFRHEIKSVFRGKSATNKVGFIHKDENIHEMDFNQLITNAITQKDYKNAIRLSYLKLLKTLTDEDLITWKADKTNLDYIAELKQSSLQTPFKKTTIVFEHVWYGEFTINENHFDETMLIFNDMHNKITNH